MSMVVSQPATVQSVSIDWSTYWRTLIREHGHTFSDRLRSVLEEVLERVAPFRPSETDLTWWGQNAPQHDAGLVVGEGDGPLALELRTLSAWEHHNPVLPEGGAW